MRKYRNTLPADSEPFNFLLTSAVEFPFIISYFIMSLRIIYRSFFILAIAIIGFGCKSATAPPSDPVIPVVTHDPGEFGYSYNGTSIDRKDYPGVLGYGSVAFSPNSTSTGFTLDITLM